ncbi:disease resistance protein RPS5 [Brassica rapa]|uniref:disease resistance protein RPS5 n=1 Tax=Brassica campestris TaxID=3711 RepID=UPI0004F19B62|nr:disease resistance protein RPS5 [Brassica rapa]
MGGFFSVPLSGDQVLKDVSHLSCFKASYINSLEENLAAMQRDMEELKARQTDVLRRVEREEETKSMQRLAEVNVWLKNVDNVSRQVSYLLSNRTTELQRLCSKKSRSNYGYGKRVSLMLKKVNDLNSKGVFEVVAEPATETSTKEKRLSRSRPDIVGRETILKRALSLLVSGETGSIGLYGVGGVGKSTILREISNKITARFEFVIWVVVSQHLPVKKIQEEIGRKLGFHGEEWNQKEESQKANDIHNFMKDRRFALLLDDVWAKVDLTKVGVPSPTKKNKSKIAFTTRSREVCVQMGVADPIEVQCLAENDAWDLFQMKVGGHASCSKIQETAREVAGRCHGLPLALNVLGETMSCKKKVRQWNDALRVLTSSPRVEFAEKEDEILPILKYSFDSLKVGKLKSCFQYCALFPAGSMLSKNSLIEYWEVEGCVGGFGSRYIAKNRGYENINTLVRAGLLMESDDSTKFVQMHDVVRKMALWVASDLGKNRERWVVEAGVGLRDMVPVQDWTGVRKMSLMNNEIEEISGGHECHQLTTLFLQQNSNLVRISGEFFQYMPMLVVLNMSFTELEELPEQISRLFALRYLNLSRTKIERLPDGLGKLKRLEHLNLETTKRLKSIYGLSNASSLGVLALLDSNVSLDASTIEELQRFERLERLNIDISSSSALKQLLSAPELAYWIEEVCIRDLQSDEACLVLPTTMMQLRKLIIKRCGVLEIDIGRASDDTFLIHPKLGSLSSVTITGCNGLKDLTWLLFVSKLTYLKLQCLDKVEEIISETGEQNAGGTKTPFEKLKRLELSNLPMLKSIYRNPLLFPCLKKIDVERCPKLRKLPLSSGSCLGGDELVISYSDDQWIERVQWEDKATEERFLLCCEKVIMPFSYPGDL